jgi:hypothetical protein
MAQATNYSPTQNIALYKQDEAVVGTQVDDNDLKRMQVTSFTIPEASAPLEMSSQKAGQFFQEASQGRHNLESKMWTFDTTLRGSSGSLQWMGDSLFEDGGNPFILPENYAFPTSLYNKATSSGAKTKDIRLVGAGAGSSASNMEINGCICTGATFGQDIGAEAGEMTLTLNWATGFMPVHSSTAMGGTSTYDEYVPTNIRDNTIATTVLDSQELVIHSWSVSINRTIERVGFDTAVTNNPPFGYAMTGGWEITGNLNVIRNNDYHDLLGDFKDSAPKALTITNATASLFTLSCPQVLINEPTVDSGGSMLMANIPFTVVAPNTTGTGTVISVSATG